MHKLDNGLSYTVEHYRIPDFDYKHPKKGKPFIPNLVRIFRNEKRWWSRSYETFSTITTKPHTTGGMTIVILRNADNTPLEEGISLCSMSDTYSYRIGRELALKRALLRLSEKN